MDKLILKLVFDELEKAGEKDKHSLFHDKTLHSAIWLRYIMKIALNPKVIILLVYKDGQYYGGSRKIEKRISSGDISGIAFTSALGYTIFYTIRQEKGK